MKTQKESVEVTRIADGQELIAGDAAHYLSGVPGMCTVISHEIRADVRYLVELPNGERRWVGSGEDCF